MTTRKPAPYNLGSVKALFDAITGEDGTIEIAHAVTLPGRPVTVHLSSEEVVRYLKSKGWETATKSIGEARGFFMDRGHSTFLVRVPKEDAEEPTVILHEAIDEIARFENRHPLDVADDIITRRKPAKAKRVKRKG